MLQRCYGEDGRDAPPLDVLDLLVLEDDPRDVRLITEAVIANCTPLRIHVVESGPEALDFLYRRGPHYNKPQASMVLLDLTAPRLGGFDVLRIVKADDTLKRTPVVVFSSSRELHDIWLAYYLNANAYVPKPSAADEYFGCVQSIVMFWTQIVACPPPVRRRTAVV